MIVLLDMDGCIADMHKKWIDLFKNEFDIDATYDSFEFYNLSNFPKDVVKRAFEVVMEPGFYRDLNPAPGAVEAVKNIHEDGHEVYIVTTPPYKDGIFSQYAVKEKMLWMAEHFPFLGSTKEYFIAVKNKSLVKGDVLLEDNEHNINDYKKKHPGSLVVGVKQRYNLMARPDVWVESDNLKMLYPIIKYR
jgi:5'-nucleotidase